MGAPATCPHGTPIPGPHGVAAYAGSRTLDTIAPGAVIRVARIAEDAEESAASLEALDHLGLRPGRQLRLLPRAADGGVRFDSGDGEAVLAAELAAKVWVDAQPGSGL